MKHIITPKWTLNSIYDLKPFDLQQHGIRALIVDLDNTLLQWNEAERTVQLEEWVRQMQAAPIALFILSNNNLDRVAKAIGTLDIPYRASALKPFSHSFKMAFNVLDVPKEAVAVVGDQIITDIIGANWLGVSSILVKPLVNHDNVFTWVNRTLERSLLHWLQLDKSRDWGDRLD